MNYYPTNYQAHRKASMKRLTCGRGSGGLPPGQPLGAAAAAAGENRFKSNRPSRPVVIRTRKKPGNRLAFRVFRSEATWGCLRGRSPFNQDRRSLVIQTKKTGPIGARFFDVWMTGLEPATSWSLTRCATNCATSRGPFFKGTANIGILFRKNKRRTTYFSAGPRTGSRAVPAQASGLGAVRLS